MHKTATATLVALLALSPAAAAKGEKDTSPGNSGEHKVVICHKAGPTKTITITVDENSQLPAHIRHGDSLGACPVVVVDPPIDPPKVPDPDPEVITPAPEAVAPDPEAVAPTTEPEGSLVAPDKARGEKPPKRRTERKAKPAVPRAARRAQNARVAGGNELPFTGLPVGAVFALGISSLLGGLGLRRRSR
jgi:hypothetical protein